MFEKNDEEGIEKSLNLLAKEMNQAALKLSEAKANGEDHEEVQKLAGELNEQLKEQRKILSSLEDQTQDSLKLKVSTAKQQLREAKLSVEDSLPEETLQNEIQAGLEEDLDNNSRDAQESISELESDLEDLRLELEMSQIRHLEARQQAISTTINAKQAQLRAKGVDPDKAAAEKTATQKKAVEDALKQTQETQTKIDEIKKVVDEATRLGAQTPTPKE